MKADAGIYNDINFEYHSNYGCVFTADRCDFKGGVTIYIPENLDQTFLISDICEMSAHHALNIHKNLNGFAGYDCIRFTIKSLSQYKKERYGI